MSLLEWRRSYDGQIRFRARRLSDTRSQSVEAPGALWNACHCAVWESDDQPVDLGLTMVYPRVYHADFNMFQSNLFGVSE